eukprot:2723358-Pleurochrysis_carterae.AAC.1
MGEERKLGCLCRGIRWRTLWRLGTPKRAFWLSLEQAVLSGSSLWPQLERPFAVLPPRRRQPRRRRVDKKGAGPCRPDQIGAEPKGGAHLDEDGAEGQHAAEGDEHGRPR